MTEIFIDFVFYNMYSKKNLKSENYMPKILRSIFYNKRKKLSELNS